MNLLAFSTPAGWSSREGEWVKFAVATMIDTPLVTFTVRSIATLSDNFGQTVLKNDGFSKSVQENGSIERSKVVLEDGLVPRPCDCECDSWCLNVYKEPFTVWTKCGARPFASAEIALESVLFTLQLHVVDGKK